MTTVFNKIHRLKQQPGWSWEHFLVEIDRQFPAGLNEKTLYSHYRQPHKKPNTQVTKIINQLHEQCFPNPFPEEINRLMRVYNHLVGCKKHLSKDKDIEDLECFLKTQLQRDEANGEIDDLRLARLSWLLGNIAFDRIPTYRDNGMWQQLEEAKHQAIHYYQSSVKWLDAHNLAASCDAEKIGESYLYRARHNILACYLNAVPQEQRSHDQNILRYLRESDYIAGSKHTLEIEPYQWTIARDGLRFASLLHNAEDVKFFFQALVNVSKHFLDLDYKPLNYGPISSGTDFQWAIENVLTPEYLIILKNDE